MSKQPTNSLAGTLFVVSAASGAGKTSLVRRLAQTLSDVVLSVSHTTRARRDGEVDGEHYHFVDQTTFGDMLDRGDFLESAQVFGNHYGTSETWVRDQLCRGANVVLEIDWQGARQVRESIPSVGIFVLPPSLESLRSRLQGRGQDAEEIIEQRMQRAVEEMSHYAEFDYLIVNDDFEQAVQELVAIVQADGLKASVQHQRHRTLIGELLEGSRG